MKKKKNPIFNLLKKIVKLFHIKYTIEGLENIPSEPSILIGNHAHSYGPFFAELRFPLKRQTWCASEIMSMKTAPAYMQEDFWGLKPKGTKWFFKLMSYICAPICVYVFKSAGTIPVYRDTRGISTFKQTIEELNNGNHIFIYPEGREPHNNIINDFQQKFVDVAKMYYKKTKKSLNFVPFYLSPKLKKVCFGKPITFDPNTKMEQERERICTYLKNKITNIATNLPLHTVIPYANIPKKAYPKNKSTTS